MRPAASLAVRGLHIFRHPVPLSRSGPRATDAARPVAGAKGKTMTQVQIAPKQHEEVPPLQTDRLRSFIHTRLARGETPTRIANAVRVLFEIPIEPEQILPFWRGEITLPTQTERKPDKESVQIAADEVDESHFTRPADGEAPGETTAAPAPFSLAPAPDEHADGAPGEAAAATQTGRRQDAESRHIPVQELEDPGAARRAALEALAGQAKARLGIAPDPDPATQTGRRQDQKKIILTDPMKASVVRGLARYETPTRVAAAVSAEFGITIGRRQVFAYDPSGSRPPAQRWID